MLTVLISAGRVNSHPLVSLSKPKGSHSNDLGKPSDCDHHTRLAFALHRVRMHVHVVSTRRRKPRLNISQ